jgi:hypothetical protein
MRLDDGERPLKQVTMRLEVDEARRVIALLTDLLDDLERLDFPESHGFLACGESEAGFFVYSDLDALESDHVEAREP